MRRRRRAWNLSNTLTLEIEPHSLPVRVSADGTFWCDWEADSYSATSFAALRTKMLPKVRGDLKRCRVPVFLRGYSDEWKFVTLIGIHAANGNVLYLDSEGKTHQESARSNRFYPVLTKEELSECRQLEADIKAAERRLKKWLDRRRILAGNIVRKAIGLALDTDEKVDEDI